MIKTSSILAKIATALLLTAIGAALLLTTGCRHEEGMSTHEMLVKGQEAFDKDSIFIAFPLLQSVIEATRNSGDEEMFFEATVYMSMIYDMIGQSDSAYAMLKPLKFIKAKNKDAYSSQYYYRCMSYYAATIDHDYEKSLKYNELDIELCHELYPNNTAFVYIDLANRAEMYLIAQDTANAWAMVKQVENLPRCANTIYLSQLNYCHGYLLYLEKKYDEAYRYFSEGIHYSQLYNAYDNHVLNLEMITKVDSARNDMPSYIKHLNELEELNEFMRGAQVNYKIAIIQEQNKMKQLNLEHERALKAQIFITLLLALLIIALFIVIHMLRKNSRYRQQMALIEKQQLNETINRERLEKELLTLKNAKSQAKLDKAQEDNVKLSVQLVENEEAKNNSSKLKTMERTMKNTQADFIARAEQKFPQLSSNDIRLMGFIKMGLSTQVIAQTLNISPASANTSRYRLRKKLGLAPDIDLKQFIDEI